MRFNVVGFPFRCPAPSALAGVFSGVCRPPVSQPDCLLLSREMLGQLVARGATVVDIKIPHMQAIVKAHLAVITSEMGTAVESHYGEHRRDFGYDVRTNLAVGRSFSSRQ